MNKKLIAILLSLSMLLCLAACGNTATSPDNTDDPLAQTNAPVETAGDDEEPTDKEREMIYKCLSIIIRLDSYAETGYFDKGFVESRDGYLGFSWSSSGIQWTMAYCYEQLAAMSAVDKWENSQWAKDNDLTINRRETMENFTVLEDVFIRTMCTSYDALGNAYDDVWYCGESAEYDAQGRIIMYRGGDGLTNMHRSPSHYFGYSHKYPYANRADSRYVYNEDGTIAKIDVGKFYMDVEEVEYRMTPVYDADGRIESMDVLYANGDTSSLKYTYNDQEQLISVLASYSQDDEYLWTYTYDTNGNLLTELAQDTTPFNSSDRGITLSYTYDENNHLISARHDSQSLICPNCDYTCDDTGRIITAKTFEKENSGYTEYTYIYGDYYIYDAVN